jgi:hypothetical protein
MKLIFYIMYLLLFFFNSSRLVLTPIGNDKESKPIQILRTYYNSLHSQRAWLALTHLIIAVLLILTSLSLSLDKASLVLMIFDVSTYVLSLIVASNGLHDDLSTGNFKLRLGQRTEIIHVELIKFTRRFAKLCAKNSMLIFCLAVSFQALNSIILIITL